MTPAQGSPDGDLTTLDELAAVDSLLTEDGGSNGGSNGGAPRVVVASPPPATGRRAAAPPPAESATARQPAPAGPAPTAAAGAGAASPPDLAPEVFRSQKASKLRLGDLLKEMGLVTEEQIEAAIARQHETHRRLGQLLVEDGVVTQLDLSRALARKFGVSFLDLTSTTLEATAAGYIDEKLARRYGAAPIRFLDDDTLLVAMADPQNLLALQDLEIITGFTIQPAIASEEDIYGAIAKIYRDRPEVGEGGRPGRARRR